MAAAPNIAYTVLAVDEAIGLLMLVANHPRLGVSELARRSGNTKARAFRLLSTLERRALVERCGEPATYALGYNTLVLGIAAQEQISLVRLAARTMNEISGRCNEQVQLRVRSGLEALSIARRESTQAVRVHSEVGNRRPLHAGASAKLLLAFAPDDVVEAVLNAERKRFTHATVVSRTRLQQDIEKIRREDCAVSFGEYASDTVAVAAPVRDADGAVVAALSISVPVSRAGDERVQSLLQLAQKGARGISAALGHEH